MSESFPSLQPDTVAAAKVLTILKDDGADISSLEKGLSELGFEITAASFESVLHGCATSIISPDVILCVTLQMTPEKEAIVTAYAEHFSPCDIPVVGITSRINGQPCPVFDTALFQPAHPVQVANRINALIRLRSMEVALTLRKATLEQDFGIATDLPGTLLGKPFRILFVGKATPEFMSILNALQEKNVEVFAAFTSFTAFDYIHENDFDAVVLNAVDENEPALSITETMRRNPNLFHVPVLVMAPKGHIDAAKNAILKGAHDVIHVGASHYEVCGRILELANFYRIHSKLKSDLAAIDSAGCLDSTTKLYNIDFIYSHMHRVTQHSSLSGKPLVGLLLRFRPLATNSVSDEAVEQALVQVGTMLKNLVRAEDIVGRLGTDIYFIAFPAQTRDAINIVRKRIVDIVDSAAFSSGFADRGVMTLTVEAIVSEKMAHETSELFLTRSIQEIMGGAALMAQAL